MRYHRPASFVVAIAAASVSMSGCGGCFFGIDTGRTDSPVAAAAAPASAAVSAPGAAPTPGALAAVPEAVKPFPTGLTGTLVFQSDREGRTKIYSLTLATGEVKALTSGETHRDENPRWSPDGTRIAFKSNRAHYSGNAPEQGNADYDLYTMNADGSDVRRLTTDPANEHDPSWAPDGKSIVYSSDKDSRGDLYRLWLADGRVERLTRHFVGRAIMPTVSPDGSRVAFAAQTMRAGQFWLFQVHILDLASKGATPLAGGGGACWPAWMPDSSGLAYVRLDQEPSSLESIKLQGGAKQTLVKDAKLWSYYPDWSPDGRQVAFSVSPEHHEGEDWDLALMGASQPGKFVKLTTGAGNDRLPDWKPK
jgi:Tol biopolymer transport system component